MKWIILGLAMLYVVSVASAGRTDYVSLYSTTPICGGLNEPQCETIYKVSIPALEPTAIAIDKDSLQVNFRKETDLALAKSPSYVKDMKIELNGKELNRDSLSESLLPGQTYLIRVTAKRQWVFNGVDYQTEPIDNVITLFGRDFTEYAWWNTTFNYKRNTTQFIPTNIARNVTWVFTSNFNNEVATGKVDQNGTCVRMVNSAETGELQFEHETTANLSQTNYTAWVFDNFSGLGGQNYTTWVYYDDVGCGEGAGNSNDNWNSTGALIVSHFGGDRLNGSSFLDSAGGDQNFTIVGSLPIVKSPLGFGFQRSSAGNYALSSGKKFNNLPSGTAIIWFNTTDAANSELMIRGNATGGGTYDFLMGIATTAPRCSLDATANSATGAILSTNAWTMVACTWNSTGLFIYQQGIFRAASTAVTTGLPDAPLKTQLTIGQGIGFGNVFNGAITDVAIYNRTLSDQEIQLIWNSSKLIAGAESNFTATPDNNTITVQAFDEISGLQIYFNATFDNGTSTFSFPTTLSYANGSGNFTQGLNTITFRNASYYTRNIIATITNNSQTITAYLLPLGYANAISVNFHINGISGAPLSGATVTIQKSISSIYTTIAQCLTDDSGTCNFVLDNTVTYQIIASASGYDTKTVLINPVGSDYTITLSGFSSAGSFNGDSNGIVLTLLPGQLDLIKNWTILNYTVNDSLANLALFGLNISYGASQIYSFTNTTSVTGGQILVNVSTVGRVGNFTVYYFYQKAGGGGNMLHHVYYIFQNFSNPAWSLSNTFDNLRVSGASPFFTGTIIIVTTSIVVGAVNSNMALGVGTGFLAVGVIAFLMPIIAKDYTSGMFVALLLIIAVAMVRLRTVN